MRVTIHQPDHLGYLGFYHKIMNADKYVVLDNVQFALEYNHFTHPVYEQLYEPFLPYMAIIDLLFNYGPRAIDVIRSAGSNGSKG